jgi:hypothetical protein
MGGGSILLHDAVDAAGERGGEGEVGVGVGTGDTAFDTQAFTFANDAEAGGAVVACDQAMRVGAQDMSS